MNKRDCWVAAWGKVGVVSTGNIDAEINVRTCQLNGAERCAVAYLLGEAERKCLFGHVDTAAEHLMLAAAMVEQRGRVLGALRAAKAVEEALWDDGCAEKDRGFGAFNRGPFIWDRILSAMIENGFGPQSGGAK